MLDAEEGTETYEGLERVLRSTERGASLSDQLLSFSRKQSLHASVIDLADFFNTTGDVLNRFLGDGIEVQIDIPGDVWRVKADRSQLDNAILNLAINARDAMKGSGRLSLSVLNKWIKEDAATVSSLKPGAYLEIKVADTGTGIPPDALAKVFEPFYTTKEVGQGSGLGLSMVYGFAEQSGGTVSIESEVGAGTGVTIFLPAVMIQADSKPIRSDGAGIRVSKKSETVLVVEDQPDLLTVTAQMIGRMGYAVIEADNAQDALHKVSPLDGLDAAFLDVSLPGEINGIALAAALRERFPHIKILFTSGYVPEENRADLESIRHEGLFVKPVNIGELSARMGALFGGEEPKPEKIH